MKLTYVNEMTGEEIVEYIEIQGEEVVEVETPKTFTLSFNHGCGKVPVEGDVLTRKNKKVCITKIHDVEDYLGRYTVKGEYKDLPLIEPNNNRITVTADHGRFLFELEQPYYIECKDKHGEYILDNLTFVGVQDGRLKFDDLEDNTLHIEPNHLTFANQKNELKGVACVWFNEKWKIVKMNGCLMATSHDGERSTGLVSSMYAASQNKRIPKYVLREMKRQFDLMFQKTIINSLKNRTEAYNIGDEIFYYVNNVPTHGKYAGLSDFADYHKIDIETYDFDTNGIVIQTQHVHVNNIFRG